jgi:hypothetical protein
MTGTSTLYPFELFRLLEALWKASFSGLIALRANDETTTLYLVEGQVRYATTTDLAGSFPGYLLTERLFARSEIHGWLERCGAEQRTLEDLLLSDGVLDAHSIVSIKSDLGASVFTTAFSLSATAEVVPSYRAPPVFGELVLNPHDALFRCASDGLAIPQFVIDLDNQEAGRMARGPTFFRLWSTFKRWFDGSPLVELFGTSRTLESLLADSEEHTRLYTHAFLMCETGMAHFVGQSPRSGVLSAPVATERAVQAPPAPSPPPRRAPTQPGVVRAATTAPVAPEPIALQSEPSVEAPWTDPSESFADLRGSLVGADLIDAVDRARQVDCYVFMGLPPAAPLSEVRAAWQTMSRRYDDDRYEGLILPTSAAKALRELQKRTEAAYDTLTDLRRRQAHDDRLQVADALSRELLEDVFYAEGLFKAAQIRLTDQQYPAAIELLDEAFIRNPAEPEYVSYLAFAVFMARLAGVELGEVEEEPEALLDRALVMNPKLESAWLFRARMMDQAGHASRAMGAYLTVLDINPSNDESRIAVRAFREAGVIPAGRLRRGLAQRLARLIGVGGAP